MDLEKRQIIILMTLCESEMKNEMYVYIGIFEFKEDPDFITELVAVEPTSTFRKGDSILKTKMKEDFNGWQYRLDARESFDLELLIKEVLSKFKNKENLKKAIAFGKGYIVCVLFANDRDPSIEISPELMQEIADLKCGFWLDFYPFGVE